MKYAGTIIAVCALITILSSGARAQFTNGQSASMVIGQPNYTLSGYNRVDSLGFHQVNGVAVDPVSGVVYVADKANNRVLRFPSSSSLVTGSGAVGVLGQPDFSSHESATTQTGLHAPMGVATNNGAGLLYVADAFNQRIIIYDAGMPLPIQLASFRGAASGMRVRLDWSTLSEVNNYGFYAERRGENGTVFTTVSGLIPGAGTSTEPHQYTWTDTAANPGPNFYRLRQVDLDGKEVFSSEIVVKLSAVLDVNGRAAPKVYALLQNYPNPFNPATTIRYQLPGRSYVTLRVYDILGREVATLVEATEAPGYRSVSFNAAGLPSGIYFYRLSAGNFRDVKMMMLLR